MSGHVIIALPAVPDAALRWYRLDIDAGIAESGSLAPDEVLELDPGSRVCAVVPADRVALHWVDLPKASPAQAAAAARMIAADLSAGPIDLQHVSVARDVDGLGRRAIAIVERSVMDGWLERLSAHGIDPDDMVPAPMLLPYDEDRMSVARDGPHVLVRGAALAIQSEPELAERVVPSSGARFIDGDLLNVYSTRLEIDTPINLRQGDFQKSHKFIPDRKALRRLGWLALGVLLLSLLIPAVSALRYTLAVSSNEAKILELARQALPDSTIADPQAQLRAQAARVGAGGGMTTLAAAVFEAVRADGQFRVESMGYDASDGLRVTLASGSGVVVSGLRSAIEAYGYTVTEGATRVTDDGQRTDIEVRAR